jgi:hypothetical protein
MRGKIRDRLRRGTLYAEVLREGGVLLAIFGPIANFEIWHRFAWKPILALWGLAAVMLLSGVELDVRIKRLERERLP